MISVVALFVALGGTSLAAAGYINGKHIKPHSLPKNRLTKGAIESLHGAKGAQGSPGAKGDTGDPGPTAAADVYGYLVQTLNGSTFTPVLALSGTVGADQYSTGELTVGFKSRILVEANITIQTTTVSANPGSCLLNLTDSNNNVSQISQVVEFNQSTIGYTDVHVTGARDEPAGTYDIALECKADSSKTGESFLTAIAAAQQ